jgi:hypothetical protein
MSNVVTLPKMVRIDGFYIEDLTTEEVYEMEAEGRRIVKEHGGKNFYSAETSIGTRMVIWDVPEDVVEIVRYELSKMSLATLWYHHDGREMERVENKNGLAQNGTRPSL